MSDINLSPSELRALNAALHGDISDPVELMRSAGIDVSTFFEFGYWRGVDFSKSDLTGISFKGSDMRGALLRTEQIVEVLKTEPLFPSDDQNRVFEHEIEIEGTIIAKATEAPVQSIIGGSVAWAEQLASSDPAGASYAFGDCVVFVQSELGTSYGDGDIAISVEEIECETSNLSQIIEKYGPKQIGDNLPHFFISHIRRSTSDFSGIEIGLGVSRYRDVRAIHAALQDDPYQQLDESRDSPKLLEFLLSTKPLSFDGCSFPTQLSVNAAIILNPSNEKPSLVLARRGSVHQVGYYPGAWCVSFQETLSAPGVGTSIQDYSVADGVRRGLIEEFLGGSVAGTEVGVLCLLIEAQIMNQSSVAFTKVPLSFEELCRRRRHIASDAAENNLVVRVPFDPEVLILMLESETFPGSSLVQHLQADPMAGVQTWEHVEAWHPTSRLAIYMLLRCFFPERAKSWLLSKIKGNS